MKRMSLLLASLVLGLAVSPHRAGAETAPPIPIFVDDTATAGIDSVYAGEWQWMVGGGVATFDCNDDGFPEMLLAGGEGKAKFYRNASTRGGALRFEEEASGLELSAVTGAYPLDVDGDGKMDLMVLRVGEDVLMRGLGACRFARANEDWGFDGGDSWSTAFSATWEHGADWPTLAVGTYIDRHQDIEPWGSCTDNWLYRPKVADGNAPHAFDKPLALKPSYCPLSMLFTDWNRSGTPSLRISNDREYYRGGQEQLWRIESGKPPVLYGAKDGWKPLKIWGMGIASYDLTGDGYPDYFMTSMADSKLQTLTAPADDPLKPDYKDVAFAKGVIAQRPYTGGDVRPSTGWHPQFEDVNNDGLVDLFIAKGNVSTMPDFAAKDPNNLLLQLADGKFEEAGDKAGIANFANSRGAAVTDFNLDGLMDLVVAHRWQNAQLLRNMSEDAGHWVELRLTQKGANRDAIGAWAEVRCEGTVMRREVTVGGGHAGGQAGWVHFGLGEVTGADIRVLWPDGTTGEWQTVAGDAQYVLEKGKPAEVWTASR
jgi:hypothetical protein